jgi:hypothetical protein
MSKMKKANHPQRTRISHACALLLFVIVLSLGACQGRCARNTSTPTLPAAPVHTGPAPTSYADVVSRVTPAVVTVRS